mgnify:CR=1 FL=1|jgi:hypothetical protein
MTHYIDRYLDGPSESETGWWRPARDTTQEQTYAIWKLVSDGWLETREDTETGRAVYLLAEKTAYMYRRTPAGDKALQLWWNGIDPDTGKPKCDHVWETIEWSPDDPGVPTHEICFECNKRHVTGANRRLDSQRRCNVPDDVWNSWSSAEQERVILYGIDPETGEPRGGLRG